MSLILDALKKAEAERARQSGPTLLELRVTAPRRRWPAWSVMIGILLVANIVVVIATTLRPRPAAEPLVATSPQPQVPAAAAVAPAALVAAVAAAPATATAVAPVAPVAPVASVAPTANGMLPATPAAFVSSGATDSGEDEDPSSARAQGANPADEEPAVPPQRAARASASAAPSRPETNLPALSELGGDLPALRLDLHVYAERPADRYALINMHKAHEGDTLPEGARVIAIDRDGVELSYRGTQFMLRPQ
jgi:general secretion pathway protein B